jgi:hypothetical protein
MTHVVETAPRVLVVERIAFINQHHDLFLLIEGHEYTDLLLPAATTGAV